MFVRNDPNDPNDRSGWQDQAEWPDPPVPWIADDLCPVSLKQVLWNRRGMSSVYLSQHDINAANNGNEVG